MAEELLQTTLVAPIPVGHRVRVTFFVERGRGLFGGETETELPHEPLIEDLDTGITYCSERVYDHGSGKMHAVPLRVGDHLLHDVERAFEGVVRACRVVTIRGYSEVDVQTRLVVET